MLVPSAHGYTHDAAGGASGKQLNKSTIVPSRPLGRDLQLFGNGPAKEKQSLLQDMLEPRAGLFRARGTNESRASSRE